MKRYLRKIGVALLVLVFLGLTVRLIAYTVGMETGWSTLAMHWREGFWGWAGDRRPVTQRSPAEQAEFWLKTVDRVLAQHPDDAELHLAAAVILHSADWEFLNVEFPKFGHVDGVSNPSRILAKEWEGKKDKYEEKCQTRAQALATRATELAPANVEIWRARASMLLPRMMPANVSRDHLQTPRDADWETILSEANKYDPDNALYDLLAAHFMYLEAREAVLSPGGYIVLHFRIDDEPLFRQAMARFDRGLDKTHFTPNHTADQSVRRFLRVGGISPVDLPPVKWDRFAEDRCILTQPYDLPGQLWIWQRFSLSRDREAGGSEAILDRYRRMGQAVERFGLAEVPITQHQRYAPMPLARAHWLESRNLIATLDGVPEIFTPEQTEEIAAVVHRAAVDAQIERHARQIHWGFPRSWRTEGLKDPARPMLILVEVLPGMIVPLVVLGGLAIFLGRRLTLGKENLPRVWLPLLLFGLVLTGTVLLLGVSYVEGINASFSRWIFTAVVIAVPVVLAAAVLWKVWHQGDRRFSLADLLVAMTLVGIVLWTISLGENLGQRFPYIPFDKTNVPRKDGFPGPMTHLAKIVWNPLDINVIGPVSTSTMWTVTCQWIIHRGPGITLLMWLAALCFWCWTLRSSQVTTSDDTTSIGHNRWGPPLQTGGRAALILATMMLAGYLVYAPNVVREVEWHHQMQKLQARSPRLYQERYRQAKERIRNNPQAMRRIEYAAGRDVVRLLEDYPTAARKLHELNR